MIRGWGGGGFVQDIYSIYSALEMPPLLCTWKWQILVLCCVPYGDGFGVDLGGCVMVDLAGSLGSGKYGAIVSENCDNFA